MPAPLDSAPEGITCAAQTIDSIGLATISAQFKWSREEHLARPLLSMLHEQETDAPVGPCQRKYRRRFPGKPETADAVKDEETSQVTLDIPLRDPPPGERER